MGITTSSLFHTFTTHFKEKIALFWKHCQYGRRLKERRVLILGLDSAGKSTILHMHKFGTNAGAQPPFFCCFNVEKINHQHCGVRLTVWDVSGQDRIRRLWRHYFQGTHCVIFVVDSADPDRLDLAAQELHRLLSHADLCHARFLVLANKQDLPCALTVSEISNKLNLQAIHSHPWYIQGCVGISGDGVCEGFDWIASQHDSRFEKEYGRREIATRSAPKFQNEDVHYGGGFMKKMLSMIASKRGNMISIFGGANFL